MDSERWARVKAIVGDCLTKAPDSRDNYAAAACGDDAALLSEVREWLASCDEVGDFLAKPVWEQGEREFHIPTRLGPYRICELIAEGGMGSVYRAVRTNDFEQQVAIKLIRRAADDGRLAQRFRQERQILANLDHPNIARLLDGGADDEGSPYFVMELVDGIPITAYCEERGLAPLERLSLFEQVCAAVSYAHGKHTVHRDIKPGNVLVTADGHPKLLDFGIAKLIEQEGPTSAGPATRALTPEYASPEQVQGGAITTATDVYSLGVLLYELMTGRGPYRITEKSPFSVAMAVCEVEPEKPSAAVAKRTDKTTDERLSRWLSGDVDNIILKALQKDPEQRYRSAAEFAEDLRRFLEGRPVAARAQRVGYRAGKFLRRNRRLAAAVAASVVATAAWVMTFAALRARRSVDDSGAPPLADVPLTTYSGSETAPSFSPDGKQVAFVWNGEKQDNNHIYVKAIGESTCFQRTAGPASDSSPAWSPDGNSIVFLRDFGGGGHALFQVPAQGGAGRKLLNITLGRMPWFADPLVAWLPDGNGLVFTSREPASSPAGLFLYRLDTGEVRRLTTPPPGILGDAEPVVSPDGSALAFARALDIGVNDFYLLDLDAGCKPRGELRRITFDNSIVSGAAWTPDGRELIFSSNRSGNPRLWRIAVASPSTGIKSQPKQIQAIGFNGTRPAVSRDGTRLAYATVIADDWDVWRVALGKHAAAPAQFISSTRHEFAAQYSPDGARIAFESDRSGNLEIWTCGADGENCSQLTSIGSTLTGLPHWSPDGKLVAFYSRVDGKAQIFTIDARGGTPQRLTHDPFDHMYSNWSRDGRFLYFSSNLTGFDQIWKMPATGGPATQITRNGGFAMQESADGGFLYYTPSKDLATSLWRTPAAGGDEIQVTPSVFLVNFTVFPGGIYIMTNDQSPPPTRKIQFLKFSDGNLRPIASIHQEVYAGLTVSPDEKWLLYTQRKPDSHDLMLVEGFR